MAESSRSFNNVTRQIAREDILNNQRRESFKSYINDYIKYVAVYFKTPDSERNVIEIKRSSSLNF